MKDSDSLSEMVGKKFLQEIDATDANEILEALKQYGHDSLIDKWLSVKLVASVARTRRKETLPRFKVVIKSEKSATTACPFLDRFTIFDYLTDQTLWSSEPYSLDDADGDLADPRRLAEKARMCEWFANNYPGHFLDV